MSAFVPWNSQPLEEWSSKYAPGKTIELDGLTTHYIEKGSGDPIILIHGFFFDTYMWNKNIDALAERFKVYAYDLWGFGYSTKEPLDYGYPLFTRQLELFMDALNISQAALIGQSTGGGTIINYSVDHQDRVKQIVLVDAAGMPNPLPIMGKISNLPLIGEFMYRLNNDFMRKFTLGNTFIHNADRISDEFYENATRFHKIRGSTEAMLSITRKDFFGTLQDQIERLGTLNIPTLILWGREERSIPLKIGKQLHRLLPGSELKILDQAGHCPNIDRPQACNQFMLDFLAGNQQA